MNLTRPIIVGLDGPVLTPSEREWLTQLMPYGVILFSRNVVNRDQLQALTQEIRAVLGQDVAILIDQEGGRVQRLKAPEWPNLPSALAIGKLWRRDQFAGLGAANALGQLIGSVLAEVGITHTCAPVLDLWHPEADPVIGDRSFGTTPAEVIPLATAFIDGLARTGVQGIVKHAPGIGRATVDSHHALPTLHDPVDALADTDWLPFQKVTGTRWAMTAHVHIPAWGPGPVTTSASAIDKLRALTGDLWLISDCLTMGAIEGSIDHKVKTTLDAGVDLALFSNGTDEDRKRAVIAAGTPRLVREMAHKLVPLSQGHEALLHAKMRDWQLLETKTADPTWDRPSSEAAIELKGVKHIGDG